MSIPLYTSPRPYFDERPGCPGLNLLPLGDTTVLEQAGTYGAHSALMRGRKLLKRPARIEGSEKLPVLVLAPRLAGLGGHLRSAALEALYALQSG